VKQIDRGVHLLLKIAGPPSGARPLLGLRVRSIASVEGFWKNSELNLCH
jgi:hypothetical protein